MTDEDRSPLVRLEQRSAPRGAASMTESVHRGLAHRRRRRLAGGVAVLLLVVVGVGIAVTRSPTTDDVVVAGEPSGSDPTSPVDTEAATTTTDLGVETISVPDVEGKTLTESVSTLVEAGFRIRDEPTEEPSETVPQSRVVRTEPAADSLVPSGSAVSIFISSGDGITVGEGPVAVPYVLGLFYDTAEATLHDVGLVPVPRFQTVPFGDPQVGLVIDQTPPSAETVAVGTEVTIVIGEAGPR